LRKKYEMVMKRRRRRVEDENMVLVMSTRMRMRMRMRIQMNFDAFVNKNPDSKKKLVRDIVALNISAVNEITRVVLPGMVSK